MKNGQYYVLAEFEDGNLYVHPCGKYTSDGFETEAGAIDYAVNEFAPSPCADEIYVIRYIGRIKQEKVTKYEFEK